MIVHVTGAAGFLGRHVVEELRAVADVQASDLGEMDVTDPESIREQLRSEVPDAVVHLAAVKGRSASQGSPLAFFDVNTRGTVNLLEACRELGIERFVFASSVTVHGRSDRPVTEQSPIRPMHPYGASKAAAEAWIQSFSSSYAMRTAILRPNFVAGAVQYPGTYEEHLIYHFADSLETSGRIELYGDGRSRREWTHPSDVARAVRLAIEQDRPGCEIYLLSSEANRLTIRELADRVIRRAGSGSVTLEPSKPGFSLISSSTKAAQGLGWKPRIGIDTIIEEILLEYRARREAQHDRHLGSQ